MSAGRFALSHSSAAERAWWPAVAVLALAGAGLVLVATAKYGAGISPDSVGYLDVARNLAAGRGLVFHTGEPLVWWPPLYPALLALVSFVTRLDPGAVASFVNAALFCAVILLSARLVRTGSRPPFVYGLLGLCAVLFAIPLAQVYAMAWSETLFIVLVLLYLVAAQRYWRAGGLLALGGMALWTALACLTRYIGVALVAAGVATVLLAPGTVIRKRLARTLGLAAVSLAPLAAWGLRNHHLAGTFFGQRLPSGLNLLDSAIHYCWALYQSYVPGLLEQATASWSGFLVPAALVVLILPLLLSRTVRARVLGSIRAAVADTPPMALFVVCFPVMLLVSAGTAGQDVTIKSRMVAPVFIPLTLLLVKFLYRLFVPADGGATRLVSRIPAVVLCLMLCLPLAEVVPSTARRFREGAGGYNTIDWRESETMAYARQVLADSEPCTVHSNGPDALWELARVEAEQVPSRAQTGLDELAGVWPASDSATLVWLDRVYWRKHLYTVEGLSNVAELEEVVRFEDGAVYRVSARTSVSSAVPQTDSP